MVRKKPNPYVDCTVTFPEPWVAIRRPGVRLCLGNPVEVVSGATNVCIPIFTLESDSELTNLIKSYAHYFHSIKGRNAPNIMVSYLSVPRLILLLRCDVLVRRLVLSSPLSIVEG